MPKDSIQVSGVVPTTAARVYEAWLDAADHAAMTGGAATVAGRRAGARFTAWDGYIRGKHLTLDPGKRIVQSWRSSDFPDGAADSRLEVTLSRAPGGTRVTIRHSGLPEGQGAGYREGWHEHYLRPMRRFFAAERRGKGSGPAPRRVARRTSTR